MRRYWYYSLRRNDRKLVKNGLEFGYMQWKSFGLLVRRGRSHCVLSSHVKRGRGRSRTLKEITEKDLMMNSILENLVFI